MARVDGVKLTYIFSNVSGSWGAVSEPVSTIPSSSRRLNFYVKAHWIDLQIQPKVIKKPFEWHVLSTERHVKWGLYFYFHCRDATGQRSGTELARETSVNNCFWFAIFEKLVNIYLIHQFALRFGVAQCKIFDKIETKKDKFIFWWYLRKRQESNCHRSQRFFCALSIIFKITDMWQKQLEFVTMSQTDNKVWIIKYSVFFGNELDNNGRRIKYEPFKPILWLLTRDNQFVYDIEQPIRKCQSI